MSMVVAIAYRRGEPVLFDRAGLPHTLPDLLESICYLEMQWERAQADPAPLAQLALPALEQALALRYGLLILLERAGVPDGRL